MSDSEHGTKITIISARFGEWQLRSTSLRAFLLLNLFEMREVCMRKPLQGTSSELRKGADGLTSLNEMIIGQIDYL